MLADGMRHKIIGFIDVAPRRARLYVSKESCSAGIASTMRRCLSGWGVPSHLRIDNGSDYTSKHMWRVYDDLDIDVEVCPPFTPEMKPHIERFFRTFSHDLLEFLPGYVGHSVAERKDIEARRSFADRMMDRNEVIEIRMTAAELQDFCDQWCDNVYAHRKHSSLKKTPFEATAAYTGAVSKIENERALDILLSPMSGDGWCTVGKKGVRTGKGRYDAAELGGLEGSRVKVLFDEADAGRVYVFSETGQFICHALDPDLMGVSRAELAAERKAHQNRVLKQGIAELKKMTREARPQDLASDILKYKAEQAARLAAMPSAAEFYTTPALDAAADAAGTGYPSAPSRPDRSSVVSLDQEREIAAKRARFARAQEMAWKLAAGVQVDDADAAWLARYQATPEYRAFVSIVADQE